MQHQAPGLSHPLGLPDPEPEERGVRGFVALDFLQENGVGVLEKGISAVLLLFERQREEFLMSTLNLTLWNRR